MLDHLDILGMPCEQTKTVTVKGVTKQVSGLGDPSSMRVWLLQAMTGRRCNEILKCAFNPLEPVDALALPTHDSTQPHGVDEQGEGGREEEFVARFHYRQTKIDQAPSTILVGRDVVTVIETQQAWVRQLLNLTTDDEDPPYLFPRLRRNRRGLFPRPDSTYHNDDRPRSRSVPRVRTSTTGQTVSQSQRPVGPVDRVVAGCRSRAHGAVPPTNRPLPPRRRPDPAPALQHR